MLLTEALCLVPPPMRFYTAGRALTLKAVPAEGYLCRLGDGVSDSVRTVTLTGNLTPASQI